MILIYGKFLAGSHDTITSRIDEDELQVCLRFRFLRLLEFATHAYGAIYGQSLTRVKLPIALTIAQGRGEMTEYDDRGNCASNMYLPNCTYYVSAPDFSSVTPFLPQTTTCQINFPYSPNIAQVQPVREVAFRDYGLDHPSKWHYRGNYASYYSTEEIMQRDLIQSSGRADMLFKNDSYGHHVAANSTCNFLANVGRNGVLPQGFDQFFETLNSEKSNPEHTKQKTDSPVPVEATDNGETINTPEQSKAESTENLNEDSSLESGDKSSDQSKSRFCRQWTNMCRLCPPPCRSSFTRRFISMQTILYPYKIYFMASKVFTMRTLFLLTDLLIIRAVWVFV